MKLTADMAIANLLPPTNSIKFQNTIYFMYKIILNLISRRTQKNVNLKKNYGS